MFYIPLSLDGFDVIYYDKYCCSLVLLEGVFKTFCIFCYCLVVLNDFICFSKEGLLFSTFLCGVVDFCFIQFYVSLHFCLDLVVLIPFPKFPAPAL